MPHSSRDSTIIYRSQVPAAIPLPPGLLPESSRFDRCFLGLPDDLPNTFAAMIEDHSERHSRGEVVSALSMRYEREDGKEITVIWSPPGDPEHTALEDRARLMGREDLATLINEESRTIYGGAGAHR